MKTCLPLLVILLLAAGTVSAQQKDSPQLRILSVEKVGVKSSTAGDSLHPKKVYSPRTAAIRSAILPGWGQVYNRKYWKLPIVYGVLGITGGIFLYNLKEYNKVKFAYFTLLRADTPNFPKVAPELQPFIAADDVNSLQNYRDEFRKNIDYSVLYFMVFWGLNVIDATVDAHLKGFDVSKDLSLRFQPSNAIPHGVGFGLFLTYKDHHADPPPVVYGAAYH